MILYFDIKQVHVLYAKTIEISGGGAQGVIHNGYLESILEHIKNDEYYPDFIDKLTHLVHSVISFHCFQDGNKRMSITLGSFFLLINGYTFVLKKFIYEMENISRHLAAGLIDKVLLLEILTSIIYEIDYSEELKLKIINATSSLLSENS